METTIATRGLPVTPKPVIASSEARLAATTSATVSVMRGRATPGGAVMATATERGGVQSNHARASARRAPSASLAAWAVTGRRMTAAPRSATTTTLLETGHVVTWTPMVKREMHPAGTG